MGLSVGIVGLPNAGKSTLFNAMTQAGAEVGNYPFTTIEPNTGIVPVPDLRLDALAALFHPPKVIPTTVNFTDIAGLVKGASAGAGLGNQFLGHIRDCDAIALVVRAFPNDDIVHVEGSVEPVRDVDIIDLELMLADLKSLEKRLEKTEKTARLQKDKAEAAIIVYRAAVAHLNEGKPLRTLKVTDVEQVSALRELSLLTAKPLMVIVNTGEEGNQEIPKELMDTIRSHGGEGLALSAQYESELVELDTADQVTFLAEAGLTEPGLNRVIRYAYNILGLLTFFTAGETEVRAWTVRTGANAVDAAGTIHTDFAKGFIRAEVVDCEALLQYAGYVGVREQGKQRLEGKEYIMRDGDVVHFRFNV